MLAGGAHISIDGILLKLARDQDGKLLYSETFESLFSPTQAIAGEIAKDQIRPEKLLWSITDWSGGEGALIYYPQDPTTYDIGSLMNPTNRGKLTTRPRRYRSAVARDGSNADTQMRPAGVSSFTHALIAWEDNILSSTNAVGWSVTQDTSPSGSGLQYADAITDGLAAAFLYGGKLNDASNVVPVVDVLNNVTSWTDTNSGTNTESPFTGCVLDGVPYIWCGDNSNQLKLFKKAAEMTTTAAWEGSTIYTTGIDLNGAGTWGIDFWTECVAAENSIFMSYASQSQTFVWEVRNDVGRPFWTGPPGFAGKKLIYTQGILFIAGNQTSSSGKRYAGIWAIPLATRSPIFIAAPRKHKATELTDFSVGCAGPGSTVFVADASAGKIFMYDIERDAIHLFDDLDNGGTGDGMAFQDSSNMLEPAQIDLELIGGSGGQGRKNVALTAGVDGWYPETNVDAVTSSGTTALVGSRSLRMDPTAAGDMSVITDAGLGGIRVEASTQYTAGFSLISPTAARTCRASIRWYDSSGTIISSSDGTEATSSTSAWTTYYSTATSPSNAVFAAVAAEVDSVAGGTEYHYVDAAWLRPGSDTTYGDRIAFLAMHGTRLFGATYTPFESGATSLQTFAYEDLLPENRDDSQAISATLETAEWDMGLPMERKALIGFYVTYEITNSGTTFGITANSRIKVEYSLDGATYATAATLTSATTPVGAQGRHFIQLSDGTTTYKFTRLKVRLTLDNNATAGVAPPILYGVTVEAQPIAYARIWDLVVMVEDEESNERPMERQESGAQIHTDLVALATNKDLVTFLDGAWSELPNTYDTHAVMVESPQSVLGLSEGNGTMRLRLRSVLT